MDSLLGVLSVFSYTRPCEKVPWQERARGMDARAVLRQSGNPKPTVMYPFVLCSRFGDNVNASSFCIANYEGHLQVLTAACAKKIVIVIYLAVTDFCA